MELGQFSVSLTVKDMSKAKAFYEALGFAAIEGCGSIKDNWLILQNGTTVIGIFKDMFDKNILTFNPADARGIERAMQAQGYTPVKATEGESGPCHCVFLDPDGNQVMFDQH
ncbi:VOC family protein [Alteromonas sp. ASW11-36]|uniref:VOC family protein n=1 Tax=Alteromonas arenosi TaxID=3055817 RepID=A0ABT7STH4_9ALTE|nr:VOC family protein [Alteromonas sp. ASW11-36]MDM7859495.1 VOC family protein [Alteromonas sp. ASW11-36]